MNNIIKTTLFILTIILTGPLFAMHGEEGVILRNVHNTSNSRKILVITDAKTAMGGKRMVQPGSYDVIPLEPKEQLNVDIMLEPGKSNLEAKTEQDKVLKIYTPRGTTKEINAYITENGMIVAPATKTATEPA